MKHRLSLGAAITFLLLALACDSSKTYPVTFVCSESGGAICPAGAECPALPLGDDTCGELPGLYGHPATSVSKGRPLGCQVRLSYGNPNYSDSQQTCVCSTLGSLSSPPAPRWLCPS